MKLFGIFSATRKFFGASAFLVLLAAPLFLQAAILTPGTPAVAPDLLTVGLDNPLPPYTGDATVVASTGIQFSNVGSSGVQAEYIEIVYSDPVPNAVCLAGGCLDFVIAARNVGTDNIEHITSSNFLGFSVDAGYIANATCAASVGNASCVIQSNGAALLPIPTASAQDLPTTVNETVGGAVSFNFEPPPLPANMAPGDSSYLLVIQTNATSYETGTLGFIDGSGASGMGFQPAPEPAEAGVFLGGLFAAGLFVARKFRVQRS